MNYQKRLFGKKLKKIMTATWSFYQKNRVLSVFIIIGIVFSVFFRTYNYFERISVVNDSSRDAIIGYFARQNFVLPQIGAFSQAPFFFGPWWYWILFMFYFIPLGVLTPWYVMTFLSIVFVFLIFLVAKEIGDNIYATVALFFAAISTDLIKNSFNIWNPAIIPILSLLLIIFCIRYVKQKSTLDLFLAGFILSLAFTIHFQTALIAPTILISLILRKPTIKQLAVLILSFFIPLLPFIYFDLRFNLFEIKRIIHYVTVDQYNYYVPNRWLTYAWDYWPSTWSSILGGNSWIIKIVGVFLVWLSISRLKQFNKYKYYYLIFASFAVEVILFRYFRGIRFDYYSLFAYPTVILLTSWVISELFKINKLAGLILFVFISFFTISSTVDALGDISPVNYISVKSIKNDIYLHYPLEKFDVYGIGDSGKNYGLPLGLLIYADNRVSDDGVKVGIFEEKDGLSWQILTGEQLKTFKLYSTNPPVVYKDVVEWWKIDPPK